MTNQDFTNLIRKYEPDFVGFYQDLLSLQITGVYRNREFTISFDEFANCNSDKDIVMLFFKKIENLKLNQKTL